MEEVIYIKGIKEAAPVGWNGSYADGGKSQSWWLPVTVVRSHVNLSASDHSEMASDINRFASCFLALCAKALAVADSNLENVDFHNENAFSALCEPVAACQEYIIRIFSKKKEHLQKCKCSKTTSFGEHNTLKAQHFPMQRYSFFSLLQHLFYGRYVFKEKSICPILADTLYRLALESTSNHIS